MRPVHVQWMLLSLVRKGLIEKKGEVYSLTNEGQKLGAHIVRLHRLWEVYLTDYVGLKGPRAHASAEEMEHILTPEIEKELVALLGEKS